MEDVDSVAYNDDGVLYYNSSPGFQPSHKLFFNMRLIFIVTAELILPEIILLRRLCCGDNWDNTNMNFDFLRAG